jgi:hypothetical protein
VRVTAYGTHRGTGQPVEFADLPAAARLASS